MLIAKFTLQNVLVTNKSHEPVSRCGACQKQGCFLGDPYRKV